MINNSFWKDKKVLITGHTGFKGSWLSVILLNLGSEVFGLSLEPYNKPNLFNDLNLTKEISIWEFFSTSRLASPTSYWAVP